VFEGEEKPILSGYSAEKTPFNKMESTREELMAMLAIEYIIAILVREWGIPQKDISLTILTDSESAKIAREDKEAPRLGSKKVIRPNIEVKMELKRVEKKSNGVVSTVQWTKSHVTEDRMDSNYESRVNDQADKLATKGREIVLQGKKEANIHHLYPGAIITLKMRGCVVLNNVVKTAKKWAHKNSAKIYLKEKYGRKEETFESINWGGHKMALDGLT